MKKARVFTIPNIISMLRLLGVPFFVWLILVPQADVVAFVVLTIAGISDWVDGYLARRLNQQSELGALLDPLADRLYIIATIVALAIRDIIPWWLVVVVLARDLLLLLLLPVLRRQGKIALPVTYVGKAGTFALLWGFPLLLLSGVGGIFGQVIGAAGWAFALWGTALYWWAGLRYVQDTFSKQIPTGSAQVTVTHRVEREDKE
jgi:cardiolipin synthase (CMP-forming)